jgi:hypothetical protein
MDILARKRAALLVGLASLVFVLATTAALAVTGQLT